MKKRRLLALVCAFCCLFPLFKLHALSKLPDYFQEQLTDLYASGQTARNEQRGWDLLPFAEGEEAEDDGGEGSSGSGDVVADDEGALVYEPDEGEGSGLKSESLLLDDLPEGASLLLLLDEVLRWRVFEFLDFETLSRFGQVNRELHASIQAFLRHRLDAENISLTGRIVPWEREGQRLFLLEDLDEAQLEERERFLESFMGAIVRAYEQKQYDALVLLYLNWIWLMHHGLSVKHPLALFPSLRSGDVGMLLLFMRAGFYNFNQTQKLMSDVLFRLFGSVFDRDEARRLPLVALPGVVQLELDVVHNDAEARKAFLKKIMDLFYYSIVKKHFNAAAFCLAHIPWVYEHVDAPYTPIEHDIIEATPLGLAVLSNAPADFVEALIMAGADQRARMVVDVANPRGIRVVGRMTSAQIALSLFNPEGVESFVSEGGRQYLRLITTVRRCVEARIFAGRFMLQYLRIFNEVPVVDPVSEVVEVISNDEDPHEGGSGSCDEEEPRHISVLREADRVAETFDLGGTLPSDMRTLILGIIGYAVNRSAHKFEP